MSIQFRCSGCGQPIEVDDEHAGKMAACPYCHRVVAVPQTSTFDGGTVTARPAGLPEGGTPPLPVSEPQWAPVANSRAAAARRLGNYAWISLAIAIVLAGAAAFVVASVMLNKLGPGPANANRLTEIQKQTLEELSKRTDFIALGFAYDIVSVIALALSIASVVRSTQNNTRGIVALVLSGLFVLCICGGYFLNPGALAS
jgi:hypothetical protein